MTEEDLFEAARHIRDASARAAYLDQACADPALRLRVEVLLRAHSEAGGVLDQPAAQGGATDDFHPGQWISPGELMTAEGPGRRIGPYKLLQKLGEGGMGAVYLAEQEEPVKRRVALKIIKAGLDSDRVVARFEAERQALALMDHPNIAKVLDAGTTSGEPGGVSPGRPYFVMELVKGIPITKFCDQEHLAPRERLALFIPICQAVQHAHQKGIIHRDLKPSNVLIALYDGKPMPKVIDFGVAKATGPKLTERTMFTEIGQVVGTLEYMSPEQAELNNLDIDTRADVYSLGVLLYELLTGSPPFTGQQLRSVAFAEMLRVIREVEPPKPSTKLSSSEELPSLAAQRKLEPARLAKLVRGDLDWIVMKCLEKDRGRRYETANGLALDVQRYLDDEPVLASPPSAVYRLGKFVRKHRGPLLAAGIMVVLLLGGILGTTVGLVRAQRQRAIAERQEQEALAEKGKAEASQEQAMEALRAMTDDVVEQLLGSKPVLGEQEKGFIQAALKRWQRFAAEQGEGEQARAIRAEGAYRVARLRYKLGQAEKAIAGLREAIQLSEELVADFPSVARYRKNLAHSFHSLGYSLAGLGRRAEAEPAYRQALAIGEQLVADVPDAPLNRSDLAGVHINLGVLLYDLGRRAEAEAALRQALAIQKKLAAEFPSEAEYRRVLGASHKSLGVLFAELGKGREAEESFRQALAIKEKLATEFPGLPEYREELAETYNNLGILLGGLGGLGRPGEAEAAHRQALGLLEKLVTEFPSVPRYRGILAVSHGSLGLLLANQGKRTEAEAAYRQAQALREKLVDDFPNVPEFQRDLAGSKGNLGLLLAGQGKLTEAEAVYRQALAIQEKLAADFPNVPQHRVRVGASQGNLGNLQLTKQQPGQALPWYSKSIETLERVLGQVNANTNARFYLGNAYLGRATTLDNLKRHAEAAKDWDKVVELSPPAEQPRYRLNRATSRVRAGQVNEALKETEELAKSSDPSTLYNAACVFALAAGRPAEAGASLSRDECGKRAVSLLQQAIAQGFKDASHVKKDEDLKALRGRADFKKILAALGAAAKKP